MAYSPDTSYVYIPVQAAWFPFVHDPNYEPRAVGANLGIDFAAPATFYRDNPNGIYAQFNPNVTCRHHPGAMEHS